MKTVLWKQNSKTVLSWYDDTVTTDRLLLLLFSYQKLEQGGRTVQAQQGAGTAVTVVLARFISVSGLCSPLIFAIHAIHITIWNCKKCINMLDTFYCVKTKICTKHSLTWFLYLFYFIFECDDVHEMIKICCHLAGYCTVLWDWGVPWTWTRDQTGRMNVGVAHSDSNPNHSVYNSKGIWVTYLLLIFLVHLLILSVPFFSVAIAWTLTNVLHDIVSIQLKLLSPVRNALPGITL